ncbi:hypothetical protein [Streptomyces paludis]|uniref:Secreted protein n=1 Tax=Streptomyces paludis TaxID=2282738 RepID=A0A345HMH1_9ACTN|nr:hypothetical protein [Streptomyces paludis]AXG77895.1 hypothetical protein DVK44_09505 [Streptomyces paludis]
MSFRKLLAVLTAAAALVAVPVVTTSASAASSAGQAGYAAQALDAGLSGQQSARLQADVDATLARQAGARQVSANRIAFDGGSATFAVPGQDQARDLAAPEAAPSCASGYLCIIDGRGTRYEYYTCGYYSFSGIGDGTFNNNQTSGTVARFYNSDGSQRWTSTAKATGTASWTPVYYIRPCG